MRQVEGSRGSGAAQASGNVRAGVDDAAAAATPALLDGLRERMEEVRARLSTLAAAAEADEPPAGGTVTVPADVLERVQRELVATRELLAAAIAALAEWPDPARRDAGSAERDRACVVALNMALNGAPSPEVDRYLAENFDLPDADLIVAEAYAQRARMRPDANATR